MVRVITLLSTLFALHLSACGSGSTPCTYSDSTGYSTDCSIDENGQSVTLNEFSSDGEDYVELYNTADEQVDIGNWILTDDVEVGKIDNYDAQADLEKFIFPEGTVIAGNSYLAIPKGETGIAHIFGISDKGDTISLIASDGSLIDQGQSTDGSTKPSYCRIPDGTGDWQVCELTPGESNTPVNCGNGQLDGTEECDGSEFGGLTCSDVSNTYTGGTLSCSNKCTILRTSCTTDAGCDAGVVLNEVCHKDSKCGVADVTTNDWFELYNSSTETISISGCSIQVTKDGSIESQMMIAHVPNMEDLQLEPGAFMLVDNIRTLFKAANDEIVSLLDTNGEAMNSLTTSSALSSDGDPSSSACAIDEGTNTPTPGATNQCVGP